MRRGWSCGPVLFNVDNIRGVICQFDVFRLPRLSPRWALVSRPELFPDAGSLLKQRSNARNVLPGCREVPSNPRIAVIGSPPRGRASSLAERY